MPHASRRSAAVARQRGHRGRGSARQEAEVRASTLLRVGRARRLVQQHVEPLHLLHEEIDVVLRAGSSARWRRAGRARPGPARDRRSHRRAPPASRRGTMRASCPSVSTSLRPSASVETIGFPIASASSTVSGVPSQRDGNTSEVERRERLRHVAAETGEHQPIAKLERRARAPRATAAAPPRR